MSNAIYEHGKCVDCLHCKDAPTMPGGEWQGWCLFNPPVPALIIGQGPATMIGGPPTQQTTVIAIRPPLVSTDGCGIGFKASGRMSKGIPKLADALPLDVRKFDMKKGKGAVPIEDEEE